LQSFDPVPLPALPSRKIAKTSKKTKRKNLPDRNLMEPNVGLQRAGIGTAAMGIASFVLPFIGLQYRIMSRLSPEGQVFFGIILIFAGSLTFLVGTFPRMTSAVDSVMKMVKWGAAGFLVLMLCLGGIILVVESLPKTKRPRIKRASHPQYLASQPERSITPQQTARPAVLAAGGNSSSPPTASLASGPQTTSPPLESPRARPVPFATMPNRSGGVPPTTLGLPENLMTPPVRFPGAIPRPTTNPLASFNDDQIVTIILRDIPAAQRASVLTKLRNAAGVKNASGEGSQGTFRYKMAPVDDVEAFARKIDFATVETTDKKQRTIVLGAIKE
jgi:hypothetical protein